MDRHGEFMGLPAMIDEAVRPIDEASLFAKLRRFAARLPFAEDVVAAYYCAMDSATPTYVRAVLLGAVTYFVLPADLLPDVLVGVGFTDDASVIAAAIAAVGRYLEPRHRASARAALERLAR